MIGRALLVCLGSGVPVGALCSYYGYGPLLSTVTSLTATLLVMTFLIDWVAGE